MSSTTVHNLRASSVVLVMPIQPRGPVERVGMDVATTYPRHRAKREHRPLEDLTIKVPLHVTTGMRHKT